MTTLQSIWLIKLEIPPDIWLEYKSGIFCLYNVDRSHQLWWECVYIGSSIFHHYHQPPGQKYLYYYPIDFLYPSKFISNLIQPSSKCQFVAFYFCFRVSACESTFFQLSVKVSTSDTASCYHHYLKNPKTTCHSIYSNYLIANHDIQLLSHYPPTIWPRMLSSILTAECVIWWW